jgi:hypothetical protein
MNNSPFNTLQGTGNAFPTSAGRALTNALTAPKSADAKNGMEKGAAFGSILQQQLDTDEAARRKKADEAATGLVSNALILPILKQVRRSVWSENNVFSGGIGEKAFGPQFDMQLADRIAQSPQLGIRKALSDRLMKRGSVDSIKNKGLNVHG